ncbi:phosphotriesterase [Chloroflexota bacterium]
MRKSEYAGKTQTVLGWIDGIDLGVTLPHEHLVCDVSSVYAEPSNATDKDMAHKPVNLETLNWLKYHPLESIDNLQLLDEQEAIDEAMLFKKAGGNTIVDQTNIGIGRDPKALARISRATGLNIIMGSGYYVGPSHPSNMATKTEEDITEEIVQDITSGVENTGIRAGIIGEIGCMWPLWENEKKVLRAAARAQHLTGAPLNIHLGRKREAAIEIIEILEKAGSDLSHTVMSHVDIRIHDHAERCKVAKKGCYLEYDVFGWEGQFPLSHYWEPDLFYQPNDTRRIYEIMQLIDEGYIKQILISHDVCLKTWRACRGGKGYIHILNDIVPRMLKAGMTQEQIDTIMIENPQRMLCFV